MRRWPLTVSTVRGLLPINLHFHGDKLMDNIPRDPEGSEQPSYYFEELVKGITRRRIQERRKYVPDFKRDE